MRASLVPRMLDLQKGKLCFTRKLFCKNFQIRSLQLSFNKFSKKVYSVRNFYVQKTVFQCAITKINVTWKPGAHKRQTGRSDNFVTSNRKYCEFSYLYKTRVGCINRANVFQRLLALGIQFSWSGGYDYYIKRFFYQYTTHRYVSSCIVVVPIKYAAFVNN